MANMEWKEVATLVIGGGLMTALISFLRFVYERWDKFRAEKDNDEEAERVESVENRKIDFDHVLKGAEFTSNEYVRIIDYLHRDNENRQKEIERWTERANLAQTALDEARTELQKADAAQSKLQIELIEAGYQHTEDGMKIASITKELHRLQELCNKLSGAPDNTKTNE